MTGLLFAILSACGMKTGKESESVELVTEIDVSEIESDSEPEFEQTDTEAPADEDDWQAAYLSFLDALDAGSVEIDCASGELIQGTDILQKGSDDNLFSLVDINLDGIPELIWDEVSAIEIFHLFSCEGGVVRKFEGAGRGALGWEVVWQVKDTPYYITEHDTGVSYEWHLCTIQDGCRKVLLSIAIMSNDAFEYYQYPIPCYDADGNEITEQELQSRFRELTGYSIGNLATDQEYHMHFGEEPFLVPLCVSLYDSKTMFSEEEIRKQLGGETTENVISKEETDTNFWKTAYQNCLSDIMSGKEEIRELLESITYNADGTTWFTLYDLTDDGIPELLVAPEPYTDYPYWNVFTVSSDGDYQYLV